MGAFRASAIEKIRAQVGKGRVLCGLSGGVDSSVAAVLIHEAIGDQLVCVFVDTGLMRAGEADEGRHALPRPFQLSAGPRESRGLVPRQARGCERPGAQAQDHRRGVHRCIRGRGEEGRRARTSSPKGRFIPMSSRASPIPAARASPSSRTTMSAACRERMRMGLVEPLRELFKDEGAPRSAASSGCPSTLSGAIRFRGPGLAIRIPGEIHAREARTSCARPTRSIWKKIRAAGLYDRHLAGVCGVLFAGAHGRRHGRFSHLRSCLRAESRHLERRHDGGLLSVPARFPRRVATRIINEVQGINRVVYGRHLQAPGTIGVGVN